jgi:hypothetical protein
LGEDRADQEFSRRILVMSKEVGLVAESSALDWEFIVFTQQKIEGTK